MDLIEVQNFHKSFGMRDLENNLPVVARTLHVPQPPLTLDAEFEAQAAHVTPAHYLWILRRQAWRIVSFVVAAVFFESQSRPVAAAWTRWPSGCVLGGGR